MYVLKIASPVIFVVGIAANILCFFIFTSKRMKNLPTFKFLAYLSLIDCLHIATGMPHIMFIIYGNDYDFRTSSDFVCSFHSFLTIYTSHLSSNVLAAIGDDNLSAFYKKLWKSRINNANYNADYFRI